MSQSFGQEYRRKYPRKSFRKIVSFMYGGKGGLANGVEIGEGGMSFSTPQKLDTNKKAIINFFIGDKEFFSVQVTLLNIASNSRFHTYGTSFDSISPGLKRQIRTYVARTLI